MTAPTAAPAGPSRPVAPLVPPVAAEQERRRRLVAMKRRATALLAAVTLVFLGVTIFGGSATWAGYVQATAEAAMVGGLADWFAVTALFRHPLGIPIPHTAIIVERKDQFAVTLGGFIQDAFLTDEAIIARLRAAGMMGRLADWLLVPDNAARVAAEVSDGAVTLADLLRDEDVHQAIENVARSRLDSMPVAPMAGRALEFVIRDGRHQQALDAGLRELDRYLDENRENLRLRLGQESPWWLPNAAEDRIFERLIAGARAVIGEMLHDREHHLRVHIETRLEQFANDLQHSPEYWEKGENLKREVLGQPEIREWVASMWTDAKVELRRQAADPDSELRRRLTTMVMAGGRRLQDDPVLAAKLDSSVEKAVVHLVERFRGEIVELISGTISRWDSEETASRLELLLGPDLQYIRINGTVVGALAGLTLHAVAQLLAR